MNAVSESHSAGNGFTDHSGVYTISLLQLMI